MDFEHCRILKESLAGERAVNEQTFTSISVLGERLERLKKLDGIFEDVAFSPAVRKMARQKSAIAVG